jgi:putative membrane protein insertion efficiency factor
MPRHAPSHASVSHNGSPLHEAPSQDVTDGDEAGTRRPSVLMPTSRLGRVVVAPVVAYRRWISPVLPPRCRFYPSCSEYALTAVAVHGPVRGVWLAVRRLLRCHPFHPGGIDHVPTPHTSNRSAEAA